MADTPLREGFVDVSAGWRLGSGFYGRLEGGARLTPRSAIYGFGELHQDDAFAGVGYRWEFDF